MKASNGHSTTYEIVSCGIDWITATASGGKASRSFDDIGETILKRDADANEKIAPTTRLGFVGYMSEHFFVGHRGRERMIQAGGGCADVVASDIVEVASNVSRLDVQATVFTDKDKPNLALHGYSHLKANPPRSGRPSKLTLIQSQPEGDGLLIGSRRSDFYARLYDKGVESKQAPPRTLWRYEVEAKRGRALSLANRICGSANRASIAAAVVREWFCRKGLEPFYSEATVGFDSLFHIDKAHSDPLRWFRSTVSKAIRAAAARYGWDVVLGALELDATLREDPTEGGDANANTVRPVPTRTHREHLRADYEQHILFHDEG